MSITHSTAAEENVLPKKTTSKSAPTLEKLISGEEILRFQEVVQRVPVPDHIYDTAVEMGTPSDPPQQ